MLDWAMALKPTQLIEIFIIIDLIDIVLGVSKSVQHKRYKSGINYIGNLKHVNVLIILVILAVADTFMKITPDYIHTALVYTTALFIFNQLGSIYEHLIDLNYKIPKFIKEKIDKYEDI